MNTPKEEAEELVKQFWAYTDEDVFAVKCAIICVDRMIKAYSDKNAIHKYGREIDYWNCVKSELEKMK